MSQKLGEEIPYINETVEEAYASRKKWEAKDWEYDSWVSTYTAIAKGEQDGVSGDLERVLGRRAASLEEYPVLPEAEASGPDGGRKAV